MGRSRVFVTCAIACLAGCRFGMAVGTSRRTGDDTNVGIGHIEGGAYAANGLGGFILVGGKPAGREDNDSIHNNETPWLVAEGRYRYAWLALNPDLRIYSAAGLGLGISRSGPIGEAQLELGVELDSGTKSMDLSLRYSPIVLIGDEHPTHAILVGFAVGAKR